MDSELYAHLDHTKHYQLMTAGVQAGKTQEMLVYCYWSLKQRQNDVIFILKNSKADREQLVSRIRASEQFQKLSYVVNINGAMPRSKSIFICLGNGKSLEKCYKKLVECRRDFHVCVDEADLSIKTKEGTSKFEQVYRNVITQAKHVLGATATSVALHIHEKLDDVVNLQTPENYVGLQDININILSADDDCWKVVYEDVLSKEKFRLILHVETRVRKYQYELAEKLSGMYPSIIFVVFNGDGITIYKTSGNKQFLKEEKSISKVIQDLGRSETTRNISIIAGGLAARGISYVSTDFKMHLTDQIYLPNESVHGESLIQSLRLLGRYSEDCSDRDLAPTLWTFPHVKEKIKNSYRIIHQFNSQRAANINAEVEFDKPKADMCRPGVMDGLRTNAVDETTSTLIKDEAPQKHTRPRFRGIR